VIAVEPVAGMRATLSRAAPGAEVRAGQAEALPLDNGSVDAVVAGQAFHWFANATALGEFARVLRAGGRLGLIWNGRDREQPLQAAISRIIEPYRQGTPQHAGERWRAAFTDDAPFALAAERKLPHAQALDADGLADRVLSISFVAALSPEQRERVDAHVRELAAGGTVELRYVTEVSVYDRRR
jgi:SAM-dependent methyltransferase